jgi:peroxiredoxin
VATSVTIASRPTSARCGERGVFCLGSLALLLTLALAACGQGGDGARAGATGAAASDGGAGPARVEVGWPVPAYTARTLEGQPTALAALRGRPVLLNVWATWCHPCREEIPALETLHRRHSWQGLQVVGVSVDAAGEEGAIRDFARQFGMTYPIWLDPDDQVSTTFLLVGVPATFLIAKDGTLLWRHVGPIRTDDPTLTEALARAL